MSTGSQSDAATQPADAAPRSTGLPTDPSSARFHGLDALRAWAMSMGIVLHAAWIMTPGESGAPSTDASASAVCAYIGDSIHMFRMQLFFLLAGFFACLLVRKRGVRRFSWNRTLRIVVPFLLFWAVLRPVMMTQWQAAKIRSGADQSGDTAWNLMLKMYDNFSAETFLTMHLWFVWYLCCIYVIVLLARGLVMLIDRSGKWRDAISERFGRIAISAWAPLALAIGAAPLMFPMEGVYGIEMDPWSLYPKIPGLLSYLAYFLVGWLIYRNVDRLPAMLQRWQWQLGMGCLLTVPFFFGARYASEEGYATVNYPLLSVPDVRYDRQLGERVYPRLRRQLLESGDDSIAQATWSRIPAGYQEFVRAHPRATENQLLGLLTAISSDVISDDTFAEKLNASELTVSDQVAALLALDAQDRTSDESKRLNRELIEIGFPGTFYSEDTNRPYYRPLRAAYCFYYSLTTWLLIFGCLGFAQHFFTSHSRFWRYFSDSSYWMYLMHLVVQFQILLWVGELPWHWSLKFLFYVAGTLAVLVPTYHILVRPTWIGWLLSGRVYPILRPRQTQGPSSDPPAIAPAPGPA